MPSSVFSSLKISTAALPNCLQGLQANAFSSHPAKRDRYPLCYIIHDYRQNCSICFSFCCGFLKVQKRPAKRNGPGTMFNQTPSPVHPLTGPVISDSSVDAALLIRTQKFYSRPISIIFSAICTEFQAAPFNRLSETTHIWNPLSTSTSLRIRPTNVSFFPTDSRAVG